MQRNRTEQQNGKDLFKKRDTKGTLQEKMGIIKDRNGKDLIEAEEIRKSGKNTQKNYTIMS